MLCATSAIVPFESCAERIYVRHKKQWKVNISTILCLFCNGVIVAILCECSSLIITFIMQYLSVSSQIWSSKTRPKITTTDTMCLKQTANIYIVTSLLTERVQLHGARHTHHPNRINQNALYLFNLWFSERKRKLCCTLPIAPPSIWCIRADVIIKWLIKRVLVLHFNWILTKFDCCSRSWIKINGRCFCVGV